MDCRFKCQSLSSEVQVKFWKGSVFHKHYPFLVVSSFIVLYFAVIFVIITGYFQEIWLGNYPPSLLKYRLKRRTINKQKYPYMHQINHFIKLLRFGMFILFFPNETFSATLYSKISFKYSSAKQTFISLYLEYLVSFVLSCLALSSLVLPYSCVSLLCCPPFRLIKFAC